MVNKWAGRVEGKKGRRLCQGQFLLGQDFAQIREGEDSIRTEGRELQLPWDQINPNVKDEKGIEEATQRINLWETDWGSENAGDDQASLSFSPLRVRLDQAAGERDEG